MTGITFFVPSLQVLMSRTLEAAKGFCWRMLYAGEGPNVDSRQKELEFFKVLIAGQGFELCVINRAKTNREPLQGQIKRAAVARKEVRLHLSPPV